MKIVKLLVVVAFVALIATFYVFELGRYMTLDFVQSQLQVMQEYSRDNFFTVAAIYFLVYVTATALSIPGSVIITLVGGAVFGLWWGTLLVSFASTIGATLAFLTSRLLLRDWVQSRFGNSLKAMNAGIEKDGNFYLFSLRIVPVFPFFSGESADGAHAYPHHSLLRCQPGRDADGNADLRERRL